jgi:hypothetical protein
MVKIIDNRPEFQAEELRIGNIVVDMNNDNYLVAEDQKNKDFIAINLESLNIEYREDSIKELFDTILNNGSGGIAEVIEPEQYAIVIEELNKE